MKKVAPFILVVLGVALLSTAVYFAIDPTIPRSIVAMLGLVGVSHALAKLDNYKMEYGKKLLVHINHSQTIEDILDVLLID
jgi:hypothetical protein